MSPNENFIAQKEPAIKRTYQFLFSEYITGIGSNMAEDEARSIRCSLLDSTTKELIDAGMLKESEKPKWELLFFHAVKILYASGKPWEDFSNNLAQISLPRIFIRNADRKATPPSLTAAWNSVERAIMSGGNEQFQPLFDRIKPGSNFGVVMLITKPGGEVGADMYLILPCDPKKLFGPNLNVEDFFTEHMHKVVHEDSMVGEARCGSCICNMCGKVADDGIKLKMCRACLNAWYCSVECQKAHWKKHKSICQAFGKSKHELLPNT